MNTDDPYPHFFHLFGPQLVQSVKFSGHGLISFIGFGPRGVNSDFFSKYAQYLLPVSDLTAAPEVGYNLTYVCPEGQVFDHDWFATPFVFMTCQVI